MEYLAQWTLPIDRTLVYQLKKLAVRYFLQNEILFKRGYSGDPLRCLGPREAREVGELLANNEKGLRGTG